MKRTGLLFVLTIAITITSLSAKGEKIKLAASLMGKNTEPYAQWLLGPFNKKFSVVSIKPEDQKIPTDCKLAIISRTFIEPVIRFEGMKISSREIAPGKIFHVTYYWRKMTSDPVPYATKCYVHYRKGRTIFINGDHNFKTPIKDWPPGKLYVDGPYDLKFPERTPKGELSVQLALNKVRLISGSKGNFTEPTPHRRSFFEPMSVKLTNNPCDEKPFITCNEKLPGMTKPYASLKNKIEKYLENGGSVLFYGKPMKELSNFIPVEIKDSYGLKIFRPGNFLGKFASKLPQAFIETELKKWAETINYFGKNSPALITGKSSKGKVYYWAGGLGRDYQMPPLEPYFDQFLVRTAYRISGKNAEEIAKIYSESHKTLLDKEKEIIEKCSSSNLLGFIGLGPEKPERAGVSQNNFGRFGWLNDDGCLVGELTEKGEYVHKSKSYEFLSCGEGLKRIDLSGYWDIIPDPDEKFSVNNLPGNGWRKYMVPGVFESVLGNFDGIVWHKKNVFIPKSFKNEELFLDFGAIDDCDETYFNGKLIGSTTMQTINSYNAPRHYKIPEYLIKYGKINSITVKVLDIRGEGGINKGQVQIAEKAASDESAKLQTLSTNWFSKTMEKQFGEKSVKYINSLALPGITIETSSNKLTISGLQPSFLAWSSDGKMTPVKCKASKIVFKLDDKNKWDKNILLGWSLEDAVNNKACPFLIAFQKQPEKIKRTVSSLEISFPEKCGRLAFLFPYGNKAVKVSEMEKWDKNIPEKLLKSVEFWRCRALNLPTMCYECFSVDKNLKIVKIFDRYEYSKTEDDWETELVDWAPVPPLVAFEGLAGMLKWPPRHVVDTACMTSFGPLYANSNSNLLKYTLPLPPSEHYGIIKFPENEKLNKLSEEHFILPGKWRWRYSKLTDGKWKTWGGRTFKDAFPEPEKTDSLDMTKYRRAVGASCAKFVMGKKGIKKLNEITKSYYKLYNFYQPVSMQRWRKEPFTGIEYPINTIFNSDAKMYYDINEFCSAQQYVDNIFALYSGDWPTIASNWSLARLNARFPYAMHDWAYMASGCRESGKGAWVDMLNGEMAGSIAHARVAETLGDEKTADWMWYMAARQAVPTTGRMFFRDYAKGTGFFSEKLPDDDQFVTGFRENMPNISTISSKRGTPYLYDNAAYGISPELMLLQKKYALKESLEFERSMEKYAPDWREKPIISEPWARIYARAFLGYPQKELLNELKTADIKCEQLWKNGRWGINPEVPALLSCRDGNFFMMDWSGFKILEAFIENNDLNIKFLLNKNTASIIKNRTIKIFSRKNVKSVCLDEKIFNDWNQNKGTVQIKLDNISQDKIHTLKIIPGKLGSNSHIYIQKLQN